MAALLNDAVRKEVGERLARLEHPARIVLFTQQYACSACREQQKLLEEIVAAAPALRLELRDLDADAAEAKRYGIDKVPATAVVGDRDYGIRFYGVTGGYEFGSLIEAVVMVSTGRSGLEPGIETLARRIVVPVHLEILVTLTCPYCPNMVRLAHQLAFVNERIRADMVDAAAFPVLAQRYAVQGVPRTVVNERPAFEGALPAADALLQIIRLADPEAYEALDAQLRTARGERKATDALPQAEYDLAVVGAGPAAMAAAIYAVRKGHSVALLGAHPGGQITDSAVVENYLGMMEVGGSELAEMFRRHLESYPVSERLHARIASVRRSGAGFELQAEDGAVYRARSVIYAAGKQYRRLNVPGESRFIGRGIAFCATCDAPLFRDRSVAVVGGGNSALTAVRDLAGYARAIHLIHMLDSLQADQVLIDAIRAVPNVTLHLQTQVQEFLGGENLTGVRLATVDGSKRYDLQVEGVFLEIGLVPNTAPLAGLIELDSAGQIPVGRDQGTVVPGLFAAGDATDQRDKQIIIAAGDGAQAALSADRFLAQQTKPEPPATGQHPF